MNINTELSHQVLTDMGWDYKAPFWGGWLWDEQFRKDGMCIDCTKNESYTFNHPTFINGEVVVKTVGDVLENVERHQRESDGFNQLRLVS